MDQATLDLGRACGTLQWMRQTNPHDCHDLSVSLTHDANFRTVTMFDLCDACGTPPVDPATLPRADVELKFQGVSFDLSQLCVVDPVPYRLDIVDRTDSANRTTIPDLRQLCTTVSPGPTAPVHQQGAAVGGPIAVHATQSSSSSSTSHHLVYLFVAVIILVLLCFLVFHQRRKTGGPTKG